MERRDHIAPEHIHRPLGARIATFFDTISNACYFLKDEYPVHASLPRGTSENGQVRKELQSVGASSRPG